MYSEFNVPIKYTKYTTTVTVYDTGLRDWENLENSYREEFLRDKVVCRLDATLYLRKYFEESTVRKYRPVLLMIAKGLVTDAEQFSDCIKDFMKCDDKFRQAIQDIYNSCPETQSFGSYIIDVLADVFKNTEAMYRSFFRGKPEVVICISDGYLYFSVEDCCGSPVLPEQIDCEVLSYAKNWRGDFQYIE